MIYLDEFDKSFNTFDDLIHWFCIYYPANENITSKEAVAFIKHHFPLINLDRFWISVTMPITYDGGFGYPGLSIDYNKSELQHHYPEYFL